MQKTDDGEFGSRRVDSMRDIYNTQPNQKIIELKTKGELYR